MKRGRKPNRFSRGDLQLAFEMASQVNAYGITLHMDRGDVTIRLREYERTPSTSGSFSFNDRETEPDDWTETEEAA